jgi:hypothetical protein
MIKNFTEGVRIFENYGNILNTGTNCGFGRVKKSDLCPLAV